MRSLVVLGLLSGACGTAVLSASDVIERQLLGRRPVYAVRKIALRLWPDLRHRPAELLQTMIGLRLGYGTSLGVVRELASKRGRFVVDALGVAASIFCFECLAMPLVGATPKLSRWPARDRWFLALHTAVYGLATELSSRCIVAACERASRRVRSNDIVTRRSRHSRLRFVAENSSR
jgi:hypothetical protein